MSDNPVFVYAAVYADRAAADADYDSLLDAARRRPGRHLRRRADVQGRRRQGPCHQAREAHAARRLDGRRRRRAGGDSLSAGDSGSAVVGAVAGGGIGHAMGGMSRNDAKELGEHLDDGRRR